MGNLKKWGLYALFVVIALAVVGAIFGEPKETINNDDVVKKEGASNTNEDSEVALSSKVESSPPKSSIEDTLKLGVTLGVTPEQFGERVEKTLSALNIDSGSWDRVNDTGEYFDLIIKDYPDNITLTGSIDKNGKLRSLQYQLATTQAQGSALTLSALILSAVQAVDPSLDGKEAQEVSVSAMSRVSTEFVKDRKTHREVHSVGGNTYVSEMSPASIIFRIDPTEASDYVE